MTHIERTNLSTMKSIMQHIPLIHPNTWLCIRFLLVLYFLSISLIFQETRRPHEERCSLAQYHTYHVSVYDICLFYLVSTTLSLVAI